MALIIKEVEILGELGMEENLQTLSEDSLQLMLKPDQLLNYLSFSHFIELLKVDNVIHRLFYEIQTIKGNWTVRQLRRQIGSLLYERTGLSHDKKTLLEQLQQTRSLPEIKEVIRDPYVFEFLGLQMKDVFLEKDLENALLNHLQDFLLELGTGFCFEARQKSFLIDNKRYKIDLLFYHRVLKCHILIDLKIKEFGYEDAGQMNFYLNYFKENELETTDNPPIGIVLCTYKNDAVVRYATGAMDNQIFISRYMLQLPDEAVLQQFLIEEQKRLGNIT